MSNRFAQACAEYLTRTTGILHVIWWREETGMYDVRRAY